MPAFWPLSGSCHWVGFEGSCAMKFSWSVPMLLFHSGLVGAEVQMTTRIPVSPKVREKIFSYAEIDLQLHARGKQTILSKWSGPSDFRLFTPRRLTEYSGP